MITTKKYPQNLCAPKNINFSKNLKNIEIQNFEPKKNDPSLRMYENIRIPWGRHAARGMKWLSFFSTRQGIGGLQVGDPHRSCCFMFLSKTLYSLLSTGQI